MIGWVKLQREFCDWRYYKDTNVKIVFLHLLINCAFSETGAYGYVLSRGQYLTTVKRLSDELNISQQNVRTALKKLQKSETITLKSTNKFTIITLVNYNAYQDYNLDEQQTTNKQLTNNQQTTNKQLTSIKEEDKNVRYKNVRYIYQNSNQNSTGFIRNSVNNFEQRELHRQGDTREIREKKELVFMRRIILQMNF